MTKIPTRPSNDPPAAIKAAAPLVWPLPMVAYVDHCAREYALFWGKLAQAHGLDDASKAELELGRSLSLEAYTAWLDLWFIPSKVWRTMFATPTAGQDS